MNVSDFDYSFPPELVAQRPLPERDASRMMLLDRISGAHRDATIADLPDQLRPGDVIVVNDSRVIPARLFGTAVKGQPIELLVVEPLAGEAGCWRCLCKRAKRMRAGDRLFFGMQATATVVGREPPYLVVRFPDESLARAMRHHGVPPLPPYIAREGYGAYTDEDRERYQTVYADRPGSAAAPTAGLHVSDALLDRIRERGATVERVTLHVGIDTFQPVRAERIEEHAMHGERVELGERAAEGIALAKRNGRRVIAVGTTTVRALESAAARAADEGASSERFDWPGGAIAAGAWTTDLFIAPGFDFRVIDGLLTNFHLPKSTLLMMVAAFAGREHVLAAYADAIAWRYRLFSFGDCMFIS